MVLIYFLLKQLFEWNFIKKKKKFQLEFLFYKKNVSYLLLFQKNDFYNFFTKVFQLNFYLRKVNIFFY